MASTLEVDAFSVWDANYFLFLKPTDGQHFKNDVRLRSSIRVSHHCLGDLFFPFLASFS